MQPRGNGGAEWGTVHSGSTQRIRAAIQVLMYRSDAKQCEHECRKSTEYCTVRSTNAMQLAIQTLSEEELQREELVGASRIPPLNHEGSEERWVAGLRASPGRR